MALQAITDIDIDFSKKKYTLINAKQNDKKSRFISVTCYNNGNIFPINSGEHSAYIRYKKFDGHSVFNFCYINSKGKILVELTEQMLSVDGMCSADLVIVNKGKAVTDKNTGEIIIIDNAGILSTMTFYIDVSETAIENSEIESSFEFSGLNEALARAEAEYEEVSMLAKSWAVGDTGIRTNENTNNAKYYANTALSHKNSALTSATGAADSATDAASSAIRAATSETNAKYYYDKLSDLISNLNGSFIPMGTVPFSELTNLVSNGIVKAGFLYNISDDFTTNNRFKEGAGIKYSSGTNVYYTADGYWDCLVGSTVIGIKGNNETTYRKGVVNITAENVGAIPTANIASVDEVKNYLGI